MGMNLGNLNTFVQNFQQSQANARQQQEYKQKQQALAALGKFYGSPTQAPPPLTDLGSPAPSAPPPGGGSPINVQQPLSPEAAQGLAAINADGGAKPNMAGPPPMGGPQAGPGAPPMPPQGQGQPMPLPPQPAQPQPDPNLSAPAQPKGVDMDDPVLAGQQTIKAMAQSIKAANPGIDPRTLALAVQSQIENIKGISPLTKAAMTSQMKGIELQQKWTLAQQKMSMEQDYHAGQLQALAQRGATQEEIAKERERHDAAMEGIQRDAIGERLDAAKISAGARVQSATIGADSRKDVANIGAGARGASDDSRANTSAGHDTASTYAKVYSSMLTSGHTPAQAAQAANSAVQAMPGAQRAPRSARPAPKPSRVVDYSSLPQ